MAAQVGDASGSVGRILEDQAQRGGRQAGGWLLFDAALVFFQGLVCLGLVWFGKMKVRQWILYKTQEYNLVGQAREQNHNVDKRHAS